MAIDVSYINSYGYNLNNAGLTLIKNTSAQKSTNAGEAIVEQQQNSTNSALLFEYTQSIAKSNVAQQLVLDANLKETLKFLNLEAAKKRSKLKKKETDIVEEIFTDNDVQDFDSNEKAKEDSDIDLLDLFEIEIDNSKDNIFAA